MVSLSLLFLVALAVGQWTCTHGFVMVHQRRSSASSTTLRRPMAPRFDASTQRWMPSTETERAAAGYSPVRSLLRHGPKPFLIRLTNPDAYDQAVLKFMAAEACDRTTAQGNMDRYFENAQDWAFERMEMQNKGKVYDYVTLDTKQIGT